MSSDERVAARLDDNSSAIPALLDHVVPPCTTAADTKKPQVSLTWGFDCTPNGVRTRVSTLRGGSGPFRRMVPGVFPLVGVGALVCQRRSVCWIPSSGLARRLAQNGSLGRRAQRGPTSD
jgi:hypothetical protein